MKLAKEWGVIARSVQPEILDSLSAEDPSARRSRLDLRRINTLMGNFRWIEQQIHDAEPNTRITELGAGEGRLLTRLSSLDVDATGIDLAPRPADLPASVKWRQQNLFDGIDSDGATIVATLFLHHLKKLELKRLGESLSNARMLVFSEPWRSRVSLFCGYAIFPFVNHVTRHDMITSIRAGFRVGELPAALGLDERWKVREELSVFGACRLTATRR